MEKLDGQAYVSFKKLAMVDLSGNDCISKDFISAARVAEMIRAATKRVAAEKYVQDDACSAEEVNSRLS